MRMVHFAAGLAVIAISNTALAIDVSPYQPGQELTAEQAQELDKRYHARENQPWKTPPDPETLKGHKDEELIRYGIDLLAKTAATIGPMVEDEGLRYSGNNLNCSSCHLKGATGLPGTKKYGVPFTNVVNDYPNFRARDMAVGSAEGRVNGCMTRSMGDGRPLASDSREMKAIIAYFDWLAEGTNPDMSMEGTGLPKLELPARRANLDNGKAVFDQFCASCHGKDATGTPGPQFKQTGEYQFPPLAGDDTFNDGAGMSRLMKATRFIYANMPLGVVADSPALTIDQAYDVAAYMESLPRPKRAGRENDFPDPDFRPADYPVPEYFKGDAQALDRAKYGPYQ